MNEVKLFAENVAEQIKEYLPEHLQEGECRIVEITKNNNTRLVGLNFQVEENAVAPVIYMEPFYNKARQGEPMERIMEGIAVCIEESVKVQVGMKVKNVGDYRSIADSLTVAVVNTRANAAMLSEMPHEEIEDLSLICRITLLMETDGVNGSIRVTNDRLAEWGVTKEEVFKKAKENTLRDFPPELYSLENISKGSDMDENFLQEGKELPESAFPMYVLSNRQKDHGAAAVAFPQILERVDGLFSEGCYLLPSSVHEFIVVPKSEDASPQELGRLVRGVNKSHVSKQEILSDRVYEYDKETGKIHQIPESMEQRRDRER